MVLSKMFTSHNQEIKLFKSLTGRNRHLLTIESDSKLTYIITDNYLEVIRIQKHINFVYVEGIHFSEQYYFHQQNEKIIIKCDLN